MTVFLSLLLAATPALTRECSDRADQVARGEGPLSLIVDVCPETALVQAVTKSAVVPDTSAFASATRSHEGVLEGSFGQVARVTWTGRCHGRSFEALPPADIVPPPDCLAGAVIRQEDLSERNSLEDARAEWLWAHLPLLERWRACWKRGTAERCLDDLLPLRGPARSKDPEVAGWISLRDKWVSSRSSPRTARCEVALTDIEAGFIAYRCSGDLVDQHCQSHSAAVLTELAGAHGASCSKETSAVVVLAKLGAPPSEACLGKARRALRAPKEGFGGMRSEALDACAEAPGVLRSLLERQRALFGGLKLPAPCGDEGPGCILNEDEGVIGRVVARGCGMAIWSVRDAFMGVGGLGNGSWDNWSGHWLVRLSQGALPRRPSEEGRLDVRYINYEETTAPRTVANSYREGNYFNQPRRPGHDSLGRVKMTQRDLMEELCQTFSDDLSESCRVYLDGGDLRVGERVSPAGASRIRKAFVRHWPSTAERLERWERELKHGVRLDPTLGEGYRQVCTPVLVDACTGDVAEVCLVKTSGFERCDGTRLPDGRCEAWRWGKLPRLP
jgi:hypothetical protein